MRFNTILFLAVLLGCSNDRTANPSLFTDVTAKSGIAFQNQLTFTEQLNPYTYRNFYNGAGVAIGDINNDGLADIYFTGNQVDNKLYLNKGNFKFEDITISAGVACSGVWSSGATFADINADGFLDIYVCKSGNPDAVHRNNELFINNGDLTFTEKSKEYGLDVIGLSVQAAFFDYDKDGDLDCYLLTNSIKSVGNYDLVKDQRNIPDPLGGGNRFFINDHGKFIDFSAEAKIYRSNIGFGLGITLGDFNDDTWTDIFVSNDFFERDYLYINDQHGSFTESLTDYFQSISMGSMGADFADLNNDGSYELFVTEMLPDSLNRKKTKTIYENWNKYELNQRNGYYHQYPRNVLQTKIGNGRYAEVGRLAGVAASEWSWGALLFDMDNDGWKDIFIANGIYKDLLDRDYLTYTGAEDNVRKIIKEEEKNAIVKLIDLMPTSSISNYAFKNNHNLTFTNVAREWGLSKPLFSNGSAYGDLDNDGDLDLVVSNINAPSIVYRNNTDTSKYKSLSVSVRGHDQNSFAVGTQITAYADSRNFSVDNFVTRGFQSSVSSDVVIGLGEGISVLDSVLFQWPDGGHSVIYNQPVNKKLKVSDDNVVVKHFKSTAKQLPFSLQKINHSIYQHKGSGLIDFNRDRLLPMMYSNESPSLATGDIDNDGLIEIYEGGGKDQSGVIIKINDSQITTRIPIASNSLGEETKSTFIDVDQDSDLDLYLAFGGRFFPNSSDALMDKIFLNDGKGNFNQSPNALPFSRNIATSVVKPIDFDNDGDQDLFIGERFDPFVYGMGGGGFLLENNGKGLFKDVTSEIASELISIGMITDAEVTDIDNDGWRDLIIVGDWMPITIFKNNQTKFKNATEEFGFSSSQGWWHDIEIRDFNHDDKPDFVAGNHGLNTFFKIGDRMYVSDFDGNGSIEQLFCTLVNGKYYPVVDRDELLAQLPAMKKQLLYYKDYASKSIDQLFSEATLAHAKIYEVRQLTSSIWLSSATGYRGLDLPAQAQYSPIYTLLISDFDNDGVEDVIAGGNHYLVKPQFGRYDASNGWFFKGVRDEGRFTFESGIDLGIKGQIRDIKSIKINGTDYILFAKHDNDLELFKILH